MELIGMKLHANKFLPLRQAFRAFDPMGHGTITKEALYRILCNALAGITQRQYSALLKRMNLSSKKVISFEDFYAKFYKSDPRSKNALYPPQRAIVTVAKKAETQEKHAPLPRLVHTAHWGCFTTEQEFKNALESLGLKLTDGEFESAWKKYFTRGGEGGKELNMSCNSLLQTLRSHDTLNCGMITPEKLRDILTTVGIRLTPHHMSELLQRMGVKDGCLVDYKAFTNRFMSRSQDGLVHKLISDPTKGAHDPKNCGYVTKKDFIKCIHDHIGDNSLDTQISRLMGHLCPEGDLWVPYSKFLTMFEKVKSPVEKQLEIEKESFEAVDTAKLEGQMRDLVCNKLHQFVESFITLDTNNTRKMTLPIMNDVLMSTTPPPQHHPTTRRPPAQHHQKTTTTRRPPPAQHHHHNTHPHNTTPQHHQQKPPPKDHSTQTQEDHQHNTTTSTTPPPRPPAQHHHQQTPPPEDHHHQKTTTTRRPPPPEDHHPEDHHQRTTAQHHHQHNTTTRRPHHQKTTTRRPPPEETTTSRPPPPEDHHQKTTTEATSTHTTTKTTTTRRPHQKTTRITTKDHHQKPHHQKTTSTNHPQKTQP
eukprot:Em0021g229a